MFLNYLRSIQYILAACLLLPGSLLAQADDELLPPEQAFGAEVVAVDASHIDIWWRVAEGYYLYRSKFSFMQQQDKIKLGEAILPPGKIYRDEFFGEVEIYRGDVTVKVPYTAAAGAPSAFTLTSISQGCADLGVCYPPYTQKFQVQLPAAQAAAPSILEKAKSSLNDFAQSVGLGNTTSDDDFLEVDQAFQLLVDSNGDVQLHFSIAEGYYLYKDKIKASIEDAPAGVKLGKLILPAGQNVHDEYFGNVDVYYHNADIRIPLTNNGEQALPFTLSVQYQGCAVAGLCYPPTRKTFDLIAPPASALASLQSVGSRNNEPLAEQDRLAQVLLEQPLWFSAFIFFLFGMALAFTPCVFPMIPILSGIIIGQGKSITTRRAFGLSLIYVLAMALTYTVAGVIAGLFGANLQVIFQDPWIISTFVVIFVLLSLSMFGFYELQMPHAIQSRLTRVSNSQRGGTLVGVAIMGLLSALIVGPCVTAPLIAALIFIGQTGDAVLGGTALFALSMGMGMPLLAIGASAGKLLPKAGAWMDVIKSIFGVGLLAVALWLLERIIPGPVGLFLWAALFIVCAIYMGALDSLADKVSGWRKLWKGVGIVLLIWGVLMVIGAATGSRDMLNPLKNLNAPTAGSAHTGATTSPLDFKRIKTIDDFRQQLAQAKDRGQYVMLDFYADWCIYCVQMEERTFPDAGVQQALANVLLLKADVTANDDQDTALLRHFNLIAPPAILFFNSDGEELKNYRLVGFMNAADFRAHLDKVL